MFVCLFVNMDFKEGGGIETIPPFVEKFGGGAFAGFFVCLFVCFWLLFLFVCLFVSVFVYEHKFEGGRRV